jgi:hypothetical protein
VSEENLENPPERGEASTEETSAALGSETLQVTVNRAANQIIFRDPSGRTFALELKERATPPAPERQEKREQRKPLTSEEFRRALDAIDANGMTWTADFPPRPIIKPDARERFSSEEYSRIRKEYPTFPREVVSLIFSELTGAATPEHLVGDQQGVQEKIAALNEKLLTLQYRSEFFFKYAIKVPYFEAIDWEVVIKAYERGIKSMPKTPYVLLNLITRSPVDPTKPFMEAIEEERHAEFITVAADEQLLDHLIENLTAAREALESTKRAQITEPTEPEAAKEVRKDGVSR